MNKNALKTKKKLPEINTTALPDIIFMLLFFFMVVTVIKKDETKEMIKIPAVVFGEKESDREQVMTISIQYVSHDVVRYGFNNLLVDDYNDLINHLAKAKSLSADWQDKNVKIKIDENVPMKEVNKIKLLLQDKDLYDIEYMVREI